MYYDNNSGISSDLLRFLKFFFWLLWQGSQMLERRRNDWSLHFVLSLCDSVFSIQEYYFINPNGENVRKLISNHVSKFHDNPTVNEFWIIVLLRQFWISVGKEKATMQRVFLSAPTYFRCSQRWECLEMSSKPGVKLSRRSNDKWVRDHHFLR